MMNKISKDINLVKSVLFAEDSDNVWYANINNPQEVEKALKEAKWRKHSGKVFLTTNSEVQYKWAYETYEDDPVIIIYYLDPRSNDYKVGVFYTEDNPIRSRGGIVLVDEAVNYDNLEIGLNRVTSHKNPPNKNSSANEESEESISVLGESNSSGVESALKKQGWVKTYDLDDIPPESIIKWAYSPKDNKDLIIAFVHEIDKGRSVSLSINKYLRKGSHWRQSNTGSGSISGYIVGKNSFTYRYGD